MSQDEANPSEIQSWSEQVAQLERQLAAVQRVAADLSTITKLDDLVQEALELCLEIADAEAGSFVLHDPRKDKLVYRSAIGDKAAAILGLEISPDQGLAGQVFRSGRSLVSEDVSQERSHLRDVDQRLGYHTQSMVTVPLKSLTGEPLGVIQVLNQREGRFGDGDVRLIEIMASQIAVAVESARLAEEARLATLVRFIGDLSHDVKNMITPVQTGAETLLMFAEQAFAALDDLAREGGPELSEQLAAACGSLREILPEMVEMFLEGADAVQQRMADISAAVKGMVSEPHFEAVEVPQIAERVMALLQAQADKKGVALALEAPTDLPAAAVDRKQIYNALYNLIFNALDACPAGTSVTLRLSAGSAAPWPEGSYLLIQCQDTGAGMPPEVKARLFTDNAISTKPMGTGLGTKIIGNVVRAHGGTVSVESEPGQGTTITLQIPLHQPPR